LRATICGTGFKSGSLYSAVGRNYSDPEILTAYTVGTKNRFFNNRVQFNVEAFYWDYKDQQISHLGAVQVATTPGGPVYGPVFLTENAGAATIWGAEAELLWQISDHDLFSLNVQYLNTKYDELLYQAYSTTGAAPVVGCAVTPTTQTGASPAARIFNVNCSGKPVTNAPELVVNAGYEHVFDLGGSGRVTLGVDTRIETSRFLSIDFLPQGSQGSHMISNARISWENESGKLAIAGFISNIEDEIVFANSLQSPAKAGVLYNQLRPPRTYGVRGTFKF
jgi:iron complex outermembrane receptor protein